jgi:signal transduction histidine kinase
MTFFEVFSFKKEKEAAFQKFFLKQDVYVCRAAVILVGTVMMVLNVVDYFRILDISWIIVARTIVCLVLAILFIITFQKKVSPNQLQFWLLFINLIMVSSFFFMDAKASMPQFYLTNSIVVYVFISNTISGIRFRYSLVFNLLVIVTFLFYYPTSYHAEFQKSQLTNIIISYTLSLLIGYMWEWYKRVNFQQQAQLNTLINIFSHDMASPLNSLLGLLGLHTEGLLSKGEFDKHIENVRKATANNVLLLQNLVKWSKSQLDGFKPTVETVNLSAMVNDSASLLYNFAKEKNITINTVVSDNLNCQGDQEMIKLIIRNTLSNAIKFSHTNSTVEVSAAGNNGQIELRVKDTGIGLAQDEIDKLFSTTVQSQPGTENERGTGVGLYITRAFVLLNKGDIKIESKKGAGTTVKITLPRHT